MNLNDKVTKLKQVGPKRANLYHKLDIYTIKDLLMYYPRRYEDSSRILKLNQGIMGNKNTFKLKIIAKLQDRNIRRGLNILSYLAEDETGEAEITFFNARYFRSQIKVGKTYLFYGKSEFFKGRLTLTSPEFEPVENVKKLGKISPIYKLTNGIFNNNIEYSVSQVINLNLFEENLPKYIRDKYRLIEKNEAIKNIHYPKSRSAYISARQRLIFEELFLFELSILKNKVQKKDAESIKFNLDDRIFSFIENLPFNLTLGQQKVVEEIFEDMRNGRTINRLIQGDVGSGKTIVAIIIMYLAYLNGFQSTIMAPTEILAKQHLESFTELLEPLGVKVALIVGSTPKRVKNDILTNLEIGAIDILIGTHALIEENVKFKKLGLNVIDEQHRFGVVQRNLLQNKDKDAATLVMSATPIPRSLSLVMYADLDVSIINTMPVGRKPVKTLAINENMLYKSKQFIKSELEKGHQAYVICSLIEDNEEFQNLQSVEKVYSDLSKFFSNYNLALIHGKMKPEEKNKIMDDFSQNKINLLVSTTVVEVGVNVPNATVMMVYNAERFGLSTLHQLRGRVGRGDAQAYCILYNLSDSENSWQRMQIMQDSTDGFYIAQKDLEMRGFGDIFGIRQSGIPNLRLADPIRDKEILRYAALEAKNILSKDKFLNTDEYSYLNNEILDFYRDLN
ncbi:ATP-dependent DNA helicase RecG [Peptoniphilus olsenii]|uniref:ATP-dependent DNA helicase RecG n=1 Tax=Peptoniphilus olsenii TaxID=411570 RepID=A0ABV2JAW2_9FIRM